MSVRTIGLFIASFALFSLCRCTSTTEQSRPKEWTLMVYLNGASDMEQEALCEFHKISNVGSDPNITLVVELARPQTRISNIFPCEDGVVLTVKPWSGVRRFLVQKGSRPDDLSHTSDLGDVDMRTPDALQSFVGWALKLSPSKRYSLIIWDHGTESPRLMEPAAIAFITQNDKMAKIGRGRHFIQRKDRFPHQLFDSPFLSVYRDPATQRPLLLTSDIKDVLEKVLNGRRLDIIEFDACLKAMLETAYALRNVGQLMIASEDTAVKGGWNYEAWMSKLKLKPDIDNRAVADLEMKSYEAAHTNEEAAAVTASVIDLSKLDNLAAAVDEFVRISLADSVSRKKIRTARSMITRAYDAMNGIDIVQFLSIYENTRLSADVHAAELRLQTALLHTIIDNYTNYFSREVFGSSGLSIYFPTSLDRYQQDSDCVGYESTSKLAIAFAREHVWKSFFQASWDDTKQPKCDVS